MKAYSVLDTTVGYCQGMGFICAVFLLYMSEEEAFVMLYRIIKGFGMGGLFEPGFPLLFKCFFIHENLLELWLPRLSAHLVSKFKESTKQFLLTWITIEIIRNCPNCL